jgi:hypothetical protein
MKAVPLGGKKAAGRVALVDDEDYELVMQYRWHVREQRSPSGIAWGPYATAGMPGDHSTKVFMHKLLTGWPLTDHRDGNGLNNQRSNLRPATHVQNSQNRRPWAGRSSQHKGVSWHRRAGKWRADITVNGKIRYLGLFESEENAARAYTEAALATQGEYAYAAREASA